MALPGKKVLILGLKDGYVSVFFKSDNFQHFYMRQITKGYTKFHTSIIFLQGNKQVQFVLHKKIIGQVAILSTLQLRVSGITRSNSFNSRHGHLEILTGLNFLSFFPRKDRKPRLAFFSPADGMYGESSLVPLASLFDRAAANARSGIDLELAASIIPETGDKHVS
jgi:hypothetical protein